MSGVSKGMNLESNLSPGSHLGPYRIERPLGTGGMADVYYAVHEGLQRPAALKVLRASLATDEVHLQRFMQEARAAASLAHPNIVQVYDVGQEGEHRYIAQEFIAGSNLRQYMNVVARRPDERPPAKAEGHAEGSSNQNDVENDSSTSTAPSLDRQLSIRETLSILLQVLAALNKSAASGIVHRDIKPENIMLTSDGEAKVADFGLARILLGDDPQLTRAGTTLGTPMYMSPEQIQEGLVDIRSDLYSLGVTLFHMLAGRPPYTGETPLALAMQHVQARLPDLREFRPDIPHSLLQLIENLLAKDPNDRYHHPREVLETLRLNRNGDLVEHWPDHTIPLPGVITSRALGPLQATLALQSKLREGRVRRRKLAFGAGMVILLLGSFALGVAWAFQPPEQLFESETATYRGIPKRSDVEQQYRFALLDTKNSPFAKWEAVRVFFPKGEGTLNRYYNGLASIQLARAHAELGDDIEALAALRGTLEDEQMEDVIKALAWLQKADIEDAASRSDDRDDAIDKAVQLTASENFPPGDKQRLDNAVRMLRTSINDRWFFNSRPQTPAQIPARG